jgi:outer membrane biosynthesis protein TonB
MIQPKRERRKVLWAVLASLLVHFVVAYSLAAFSGTGAPAAQEEDKPVELTLVDLATPSPVVPKNPGFVETNEAKKSADKPKEQTFESNENSTAASKVPAVGDAPLPSQEGKDRPFINLETQQYSLPSDGAKQRQSQQESKPPEPTAAPTARATEPPKSSATPVPAATPEPEQLAMLTSTPPPPLKSPDEGEASATPDVASTPPPPVVRPQPDRAASDYQAQKEQTRITGRITDRGASAVNAVGTPLGRYQKAVSDAIGSRWYYYMKRKLDLVSIGTAHVEAEVDAEGRVQNLRVLSNNANEAFANICLQSFQEAKLPPIPPDLAAALPGGRMPVDFYFTTYSN